MRVDGVGSPVRLRAGMFDGAQGAYWGWPVDGYWDLHHVADGQPIDGCDPIGEGYASLSEVRGAARSAHENEPAVICRRLVGRSL